MDPNSQLSVLRSFIEKVHDASADTAHQDRIMTRLCDQAEQFIRQLRRQMPRTVATGLDEAILGSVAIWLAFSAYRFIFINQGYEI